MIYPYDSTALDVLSSTICEVNSFRIPVSRALEISFYVSDDGFLNEILNAIKQELIEFEDDLSYIRGLGVKILFNPETGEAYLFQPEHMPNFAEIPPRGG